MQAHGTGSGAGVRTSTLAIDLGMRTVAGSPKLASTPATGQNAVQCSLWRHAADLFRWGPAPLYSSRRDNFSGTSFGPDMSSKFRGVMQSPVTPLKNDFSLD